MSRSLGIPVKLLHEASGHIVTVELKSGELYRGSMVECEDNWNCQLESITYTAKVPPHFPRISCKFPLFYSFCALFPSFPLNFYFSFCGRLNAGLSYALRSKLHCNIFWIWWI